MSLSVIKGAKAGQQKPHQPSIAKDSVASISKIKIIYALGEGEVKGLVNGAASIMMDQTPLFDADGKPNFENVEWEIRTGTVDQTYISGMPNLSSEIGIGTILRSGAPWIRTITNTQLSSANINVSWSRLSETTDKNDIVGTTVNYAIDVQTDGHGYVKVLDTSIKAKTSGRYQRTHNVKLPEAQQGWQIRVRKITTDADNERNFNQMQVDSIAEIIDAKLRYPHTALLYLSFDARTFSSMPKVSVDMYGRYLKVPTNYDAVTRKSTGIWDGTFKTAYTNNPAWVYYDLITNDRYGLGDRLKPYMINKWAIAHIARICDEPVDDGKGGTEPRFTCNLYLQVDEQAYQVLQHIAAIFRGMSFWDGSQIVLDADTPRDADYVITRANVVDGAFNKSGSAEDDRHTLVQVAWSNPDNNYETDYVTVRNERAIAKYGNNLLEMPVVGCTSEGQAYRAGLAALLSAQNRTQTVSFTMGLDGQLPTVGSRVDIADMMFTGANNGGRISAVNTNRTVITVDRDDIPATTGDRLTVNLESGRAQTREILSVTGRNITVKAAFDPVAPENVWAVDSDELPTMPFIVLSITENDDRTQYTYTALQYDGSIQGQIDNGTIIEPRPPAPPFNPYIIQAPESIAVSSRHRATQGQTIATLVITWAQVKDAVAYDVEWRKDDGDWIKLSRTGNISAEVDGVYSGNYLARVRAISAFDAISKPTTSTLTAIAGKVGKPPKLLSLKATGILLGMTIDWTFAPGSDDTAYTEIQVASAPGVNVAPLGQFAYKTNTHTINGLQGGLTQYYRARIVDKLGNTSDWTNWISGTTDNSADKIMDLIQGEIDASALDEALRSEIGKIDINKTILDNLGVDLNAKLAETKASVSATQADLTTAKSNIVTALNKADTALANANTNKINLASVNEAVSKNKTDVDLSISTLTTKDISLTNLYTALKSEYDTNKAKVVLDIKTLTDKDTALASLVTALDSDYKGNKASVSNSLTTLTNKDSALTQDINALKTKTDSSNGEINRINILAADNKASIAQTKTELKTTFDTFEASGRNRFKKTTTFRRVAGDAIFAHNSANGISITQVGTGQRSVLRLENVIDSIGFYTVSGRVLASANNKKMYVDVNDVGTEVVFSNPATPISVGTTETSFSVTFANDKIGGVYHFVDFDTFDSTSLIIKDLKIEKGSKATEWSPAPEDVTAMTGVNSAAIASEALTRASADQTLTNLYTALDSDYKGNKASVSNSLTTLTNKDTSMASDISGLKTKTDNSNAEIAAVKTTVANNTQAVSSAREDLTAKFNNLQVGGTNLFHSKLTKAISGSGTGTVTNNAVRGLNFKSNDNELTIFRLFDVVKSDSKFTTVSGYISANIENRSMSIDVGDRGSEPEPNSSRSWTKLRGIGTTPMRFEVTVDHSNSGFTFVDFTTDSTAWFYISDLKIENGNKATDWSPSPLEVDAAIAANTAEINRVDTAVATANIAIANSTETLRVQIDNKIGNTFYPTSSLDARNAATFVPNNLNGFTLKAKDNTLNFHRISGVVSESGFWKVSGFIKSTSNSGNIYVDICDQGDTLQPNGTKHTKIVATTSWRPFEVTAYVEIVNGTYNFVDFTTDNVNTYTVSNLVIAKSDKAIDRNYAAIQTESTVTADALGKLNAQYTLKLDVGGRISGFGLASSATRSDFAINADNFWIAPPTGTSKGKSPFMVLTSPQTINGTVVPAGTYMTAAFIHEGAIDLAKINTATIINLSALSADLGSVTAGSININNKFMVDRNGNMTAVGGTFSGTIAADTIDVDTLKRSAWMPSWDVYYSTSTFSDNPSNFDRSYPVSHPSRGSIDVQWSDTGSNAMMRMLFEMKVTASKDVNVTQKGIRVDDVLELYVNGTQVAINNGYNTITVPLKKGLNTVNYLLKNNSSSTPMGLILAGNFVDNTVVKFA
ncbi:TipJ family phage tail tip protein [Psychrobacter sp.]|uniref:TipJ family phage tail tip protein n=1 Tax=Psychrobacter sp. TaxID=56811 RepID=UPI003C779CC8